MILYRAIYSSGVEGNYRFYLGAQSVFELANLYKSQTDTNGYWVVYANQILTDTEILSIIQNNTRMSQYLI